MMWHRIENSGDHLTFLTNQDNRKRSFAQLECIPYVNHYNILFCLLYSQPTFYIHSSYCNVKISTKGSGPWSLLFRLALSDGSNDEQVLRQLTPGSLL